MDEISEAGCWVALTHEHLDVQSIMDRVRDPRAGAIVLFAGIQIVALPIDNEEGGEKSNRKTRQAQQETTLQASQ